MAPFRNAADNYEIQQQIRNRNADSKVDRLTETFKKDRGKESKQEER